MELGRPTASWLSRLGLEGRHGSSLALLATAFVALCAQSVAARHPLLRADVATLFVVYFALEHEFVGGLLLTVVVAYLGDVFSGEGRGLYVSSLVVVFLMNRIIALRFVTVRGPGVIGLGVLGTVVAFFLRLWIEAVVGPDRARLEGITLGFLVLVLLNGVLSYPCYRFLAAVEARLKGRPDVLFG